MSTRHAIADSPLGSLLYFAEADALAAVYFPGHRRQPDSAEFGPLVEAESDPVLGPAVTQLGEYFRGERRDFELPLAPKGESFQQSVWRLLLEIPYGQTTSYGAIAAALGDPGLAQAVGGAVGRNPVSIIIPCHRVVGSDGKLTGYAGGLERKIFLLEHEEPAEATASRLF